MNRLWDNHKTFISLVYQITLSFAYIYSIVWYIFTIIKEFSDKNFIGVVIMLFFYFLYLNIQAFILTAIWETIAVIALFIPYLVIRGLIKK